MSCNFHISQDTILLNFFNHILKNHIKKGSKLDMAVEAQGGREKLRMTGKDVVAFSALRGFPDLRLLGTPVTHMAVLLSHLLLNGPPWPRFMCSKHTAQLYLHYNFEEAQGSSCLLRTPQLANGRL